MTELIAGIQHRRDDVTPQSVISAPMSIVGLLGTAPNADVTAFPLNKAVMVRTNDTALRALLGSTGTIENALAGLSAQLDEETGAAQVVVVRVTDDADPFAVIANMLGSEAAETGIWQFLRAGEDIGFEPRLLMVPGYTSQTQNGVKTTSVSVGGTGYTSAPTVAFSGGGGTGAAATANLSNGITIAVTTGGTGYSVAPTISIAAPPPGGIQATATCAVSAGAITTVTVTNPGYGYTSAPAITVTGAGTGAVLTATLTGRVRTLTITNGGKDYVTAPTIAFSGGGGTLAAATATIGQLANPICAIMPTIAGRLNAKFQPEGPTASETAFNNWLETLPESETIMHPVAQVARVTNSQGNSVTRPLSPYVLGLYVKVDSQNDGRPFRSVANRALLGIEGVEPSIPFSLIDASSKGQSYLARSAGIVAKGNSGVVGAVARSGFVFWGTDTLSADSNYRFVNVARGRDFIELTNTIAQAYYLGRFNVTVQTAKAIFDTLEQLLAKAKAEGEVIDYRMAFDPDLNTPGELRLGQLDVTFYAEEAPVLRKITFRSRRYTEALTRLANQISIQLGGAVRG